MACSIATQTAFSRALSTYRKELNDKEFECVTAPTSLDEIVQNAKNICDEHKKGDNRRTKVFEKLDKARERLEPFNGVLQGLCKLPPHAGDLLWGGINMTLQVCCLPTCFHNMSTRQRVRLSGSHSFMSLTLCQFVKDNHDSFQTVLDFFLVIGKKIPLFENLTSTYQDSSLVTPVADALWVALIAFWVEAVKHYRSRGLSRFMAIAIMVVTDFYSTTVSEFVGRFLSSATIRMKFEALKAEFDANEDNLMKMSAAQHYSDNEKQIKAMRTLIHGTWIWNC